MSDDTLLIKDILKAFGGVRAIDLVGNEIAFEPGKITAILGGNGAGKTTLLNIIQGVIWPDKGSVLWQGSDLAAVPLSRRSKFGIGRVWQDLRLFPQQSCCENVQAAVDGLSSECPFIAMANPRRVKSENNSSRASAMAALDRVGLTQKADDPASSLSYGQQKLLAFARLLCGHVRAALLDEPVAGLAPQAIQVVLGILAELRDRGSVVVVVEHDLRAVRNMIDDVVFLDEGKCVARGSMDHILSIPSIRRRYVGIR